MSNEQIIKDDGDGNPMSNQDLYNWMFDELPDNEQKEFKGKPLYWNNNIWIYPDGSTKIAPEPTLNN